MVAGMTYYAQRSGEQARDFLRDNANSTSAEKAAYYLVATDSEEMCGVKKAELRADTLTVEQLACFREKLYDRAELGDQSVIIGAVGALSLALLCKSAQHFGAGMTALFNKDARPLQEEDLQQTRQARMNSDLSPK